MNKETLEKFRNEIEQIKGQRMALETTVRNSESKLITLQSEEIEIEAAQKIVQDVALKTQEKLKLSIEPIVTSALDIVFGDEAYEFAVDFVVKRNRTECELRFARDGKKYVPLSSSGFGAVDVASFALRLALWNISKPRTRSSFVLDEPFKHVSEDLQESVFKMMSMLAEKLGIQIILVSHNKESDVMEYSNKVFRVHKDKNGVSKVRVIKGGEE